MGYLFLSYSRDDASIMRLVRDYLRAEGLEVWTDENLTPGTSSWKLEIENALDNAVCMVAIFTPNAKRKQSWVRKELDYADAIEKRVFPILAGGDEKSSIPFGYVTAQWVDIRQESNYAAEMQKLIFTLRVYLGLDTMAKEQTERLDLTPTPTSRAAAERTTITAPQVESRKFPEGVAEAIMVLQNRKSKWWRRVDAVSRLGDLHDPVAIPVLTAFLEDKDIDVRRAAQRAIEQIAEANPLWPIPNLPRIDMDTEIVVSDVREATSPPPEIESSLYDSSADLYADDPPVKKTVKIVVTGTSSFLRRQFINSISEIDVVSIERRIPDRRDTASVSMDYGQISVGDDLVIYIFGSPGEREYDFIWEVLAEGMLGFILLIDGSKPNVREAKAIIDNFQGYATVPYVVAVDNLQRPDAWHMTDIGFALRLPEEVKILPCITLDHASVKNILLELVTLF